MNPYLFPLYAWREMTTLHVAFAKVAEKNSKDETVILKGELRISMIELLKSLISLKGNDRRRFICLLLGSLVRTYFLQIPQGNHEDLNLSVYQQKSYPSGDLHEIKTGSKNLSSFFRSLQTQMSFNM
jgi:hypothetical protein